MGAVNREFKVILNSINQVWAGDDGGETVCLVSVTVYERDGSTRDLKAKIRCESNDLTTGCAYLLFGRIVNHHTYGDQILVRSHVTHKPFSRESLISYMAQFSKASHGSLTRRVAVNLVNKFGDNAIEALIEDPVTACHGISRWTPEKAAIAAARLKDSEHIRDTKMALIQRLSGGGFPGKLPDMLIADHGVNAVEVIEDNPYVLMKYPRVGFLAADKLYVKMAREVAGTDARMLNTLLGMMSRQGMCAAYVTQKNASGSTWVPEGMVKREVRAMIGGVTADPEKAIEWAVNNNVLAEHTSDGVRYLSSWSSYTDEILVGRQVVSCGGKNLWPEPDYVAEVAVATGNELTPHQLDAVKATLASRVCCLQGSPGVGKTYTLACIVNALTRMYGSGEIAIAVPTGKGAIRANEALYESGVRGIGVTTIHRLLGVTSSSSDGWGFAHNEKKKLPHQFLIIDEASMVDTSLMADIFRACRHDTHILLIGDSNQLPPVGSGKPFHDLQSLVPTGRLTEIIRNSGRIVRACAEIRDNRKFICGKSIDIDSGENLCLIETRDSNHQIEVLMKTMKWITDADPTVDVLADIQVMTALNKDSEISRNELNEILQEKYNPLTSNSLSEVSLKGGSVKDNPFRVGDKVICLKNGVCLKATHHDSDEYVANGEMGIVYKIAKARTLVSLDSPPRKISIPSSPTSIKDDDDRPLGRGTVGDWDLGYCVSVHKSQGSEWKYVILLVDGSSKASMIQNRNWLYTGISRAKVATIVIGERRVCEKMMFRDGISGRKTFLVERTLNSRNIRNMDISAVFGSV